MEASCSASAITECRVRLWKLPRIAGMAQKEQLRSQPSAIFR